MKIESLCALIEKAQLFCDNLKKSFKFISISFGKKIYSSFKWFGR